VNKFQTVGFKLKKQGKHNTFVQKKHYMYLECIHTTPIENLLEENPRKLKYQSTCTHRYKITSFEITKIYSCAKIPHFVEDNGVVSQVL
jgi:hypothetical protein